MSKGNFVHMNVWPPLVCLQVGHTRLEAYIMAFFKEAQNCNGTGIVS
jgi:hypothetical protein